MLKTPLTSHHSEDQNPKSVRCSRRFYPPWRLPPSPPCPLPSCHCTPASLAFWLSLKHTERPPASCPSHLLCPQTSAQLPSTNVTGVSAHMRPLSLTGDWWSWFAWDFQVCQNLWGFQCSNQHSPGQTRMVGRSTKPVPLIPHPLLLLYISLRCTGHSGTPSHATPCLFSVTNENGA